MLRTWALSVEPTKQVEIAAEQLPPHRIEYLDYQGPVSGNRGTVALDQGLFRWLIDQSDRVEIHFDGQRLIGRAVLQQQPDAVQRWLFEWLAD